MVSVPATLAAAAGCGPGGRVRDHGAVRTPGREPTLLGARRVGRLLAAVAVLSLPGCASLEPPVVEEAGVDGLVVPTPDPRPADFVVGLTSPWLAWEPGASVDLGDLGSTEVVVGQDRVEVAGVETTPVTSVLLADDPDEPVTDWLAEDTAGNVWWFGREGEWRAGEDGAEPGLWLPAAPRRGDGWATGSPDDDLAVMTVLGVEGSVKTATRTYDDVVVVEVGEGPEALPSTTRRLFWVRDVGLVAYAVGDDVTVRRD